ncbi:hypothetical protein QVZ41_14270 [Wenyingzhuangia sp. chi5]|uniref:Secreted protein n=1 Tax=Wenyingzhuangia gilva TaxID=3057677 RepID=A0ABT8VVL6_9FLAO|nr:hypothetical protein [Wenyingzhuangia sp. chi5]MDO3696014.1 hypothetical protein [Wenyingzhuangia sp. chi5]
MKNAATILFWATVLARLCAGLKIDKIFEHELSRSFLFGFVSLVSQSQINKIWRLNKYTQNFEKAQNPHEV